MRFSSSCAAAAALVGGSLLVGGCAKSLPASPVAAPLSDVQAITLAEQFLDDRQTSGGRATGGDRHVAYVEPTGDGNIVSFRSRFDPAAEPPVQSRLIKVDHDGDVREIRFARNR
jgi:hypothetical protein